MIRYLFALLVALSMAPEWASAYPLDGDAATGIRRLTQARLVQDGQLPGPKQPPGERLSLNQVDLRLLGQKDLELPKSPELTREVVGLLGRMADRYAIAVLDVSDPAAPRYAEHGGEVRRNPGSVGKLYAALAVFQALADVYPQDEAARLRVLRGLDDHGRRLRLDRQPFGAALPTPGQDPDPPPAARRRPWFAL